MKKFLLLVFVFFVLLGCKHKKNNNEDNPAVSPVITEFQQLIKKYPDSAGLRLRYVDALDSLQQYNLAVAEIDTLIKKDNGNYGLWFRRGKLLEEVKDTPNAINSYNNALKIYPSPDGQLSIANLLAEKKDKRALDICNNILKLRMGREYNADCFFITGVYYSRTGNKTKALQQFDECILSDYTYMVAYMEKGFIYYDSKKYDEALKTFATVANINNTYADAYYWMAKCYEAKKQKQDAVKNYENAFQLDSTIKEAEEGIRRLK